jgi:catechol 2,3-dioxygenase-like lactoylglutathione lyase family enzyme
MKIERLRQIFIATDKLAQRVAFYRDVLGLRLQFRDGDRWVEFEAGDISLALASRAEAMGAPLEVPVPVFEVDDLDAAVGELVGKNHAAGTVREMGAHGRAAGIRDPSGAFLVLFERR